MVSAFLVSNGGMSGCRGTSRVRGPLTEPGRVTGSSRAGGGLWRRRCCGLEGCVGANQRETGGARSRDTGTAGGLGAGGWALGAGSWELGAGSWELGGLEQLCIHQQPVRGGVRGRTWAEKLVSERTGGGKVGRLGSGFLAGYLGAPGIPEIYSLFPLG